MELKDFYLKEKEVEIWKNKGEIVTEDDAKSLFIKSWEDILGQSIDETSKIKFYKISDNNKFTTFKFDIDKTNF